MNEKRTGKVVITLEAYRLQHHLSKNQIITGAGLQRTQYLNYSRNQVARVDLDVLARICHYLNCQLEDIIKYEREE